MPAKMTLGEMAKALNRPTVYLSGLQRRFELPVLEGAAYSHAYFALLRRSTHAPCRPARMAAYPAQTTEAARRFLNP